MSKVCIIGNFDPVHALNWRLMKALDAAGIEYVTHRTPADISWDSFKEARAFLKSEKKNISAIWISCFSHRVLPFIYLASLSVWGFSRPPIVYDSVISIYDTRVFDRKWVSRFGIHSAYYYFLDWFACRVASVLVVDTNTHGRYFQKTFGCNPRKIKRFFAAPNRDIFHPINITKKPNVSFLVHFHGKMIPGISGTEFIVEAARILKNEPILFRMAGKGVLLEGFKKIKEENNLKNLEFSGWVEPNDVPGLVAEADVVLGSFGTTDKASKAIPLKVFECLAMKKAMIVGDSPAAHELFTDKIHCVFAKMGSAEDLAEKILFLKNNPDLRNKIAENSYALYESGPLSYEALGEKLLEIFKLAHEKH